MPLTSSRVKIEPKTEPDDAVDVEVEFRDDDDEEYIGVDVEMCEERVELGDIVEDDGDDDVVVPEKPKQRRQQNPDFVRPRKPRKNAPDVKKVQEYENGESLAFLSSVFAWELHPLSLPCILLI